MCLVGSTKCFARFIYATPRSKQLFEAKTKTEYPEQNPPMCFSTNNIMFWVSRLQFIIPTPISCWFLGCGAAGPETMLLSVLYAHTFHENCFSNKFYPSPRTQRHISYWAARRLSGSSVDDGTRFSNRFPFRSQFELIRYDTIRYDPIGSLFVCLFRHNARIVSLTDGGWGWGLLVPGHIDGMRSPPQAPRVLWSFSQRVWDRKFVYHGVCCVSVARECACD